MGVLRLTCRPEKLLFAFICLLVYSIICPWKSTKFKYPNSVRYYSINDELHLFSPRQVSTKDHPCTMTTCFDFTKCSGDFKIYVYPLEKDAEISTNYEKIVHSVFRSRYYTENPKEACIFLPSLDPLDRDKLSTDYQKFLEKKLKALPYWNNGQNHLIFNLFSGTYPDYIDILDIDTGKAILVKASLSSEAFRVNFDISLPLFSKHHPINAAGYLPSSRNIFPCRRKYLASFKGKRYLTGIGSETRNSFYKLHDGKDVMLLTTCKHGKRWREFQDQRCAEDNKLYERYDYHELLHNSTFCLAPRGRRLGSFRFLESVSSSCIPVLLANGYELPFSEVIDWNRALLNVDERRLFEVSMILERVSHMDLAFYRQRSQFLWEAYFSSVEKITSTVIEILHYRVARQIPTTYNAWNKFPGALFSSACCNLKPNTMSWLTLFREPTTKFTAVLFVRSKLLKNVLELSRNISSAMFLDKIVIIWAVSAKIPKRSLWPSNTVIIKVEKINFQDPIWLHNVNTDAVFYVDNFAMTQASEIDLAFSVWKTFPNRITGIFACSHFWSDKNLQWSYTAKIGVHHEKGYSMILPTVAFLHRYYGYLYSNYLNKATLNNVERYDGCWDISLNFLVSHLTRLPPVKILQLDPLRAKRNTAPVKFSSRNACFQLMKDTFGYIPLLYSKVVFASEYV